MYKIYTTATTSTAFFAAEELKKYLRMMMPRAGDIPVAYDAEAKDGFRIGLMADFGLDMSDAEDITLDDIIYIDTDENGGIIAGSNPGALVIAIYRYLRECGCRWLFPGVDGEWIPTISALPAVKYRKMADYRYRGQCNEGAEFQSNMMEAIDFTPKIGMNTFMIEFDIPGYYHGYYNHVGSTTRKPEPVTKQTILQWKRQCEVEIQKRGLHYHDMGHGWTTDSFGLDSSTRKPENGIPEDIKKRLAEVKGVRDMYQHLLNTNFCMSNAENRQIVANYVADYAETQNNVDFLHIWLADGRNNHCECAECRKKIVPDWYVMMLNDIDAELTRRNLSTHLVFIVYTETFWAPLETKLNNKKRFTMLYAPISRKYTETYAKEPDDSAYVKFALNNNRVPKGMAECFAYLNAWKKLYEGDCFCYEYHFWRHQFHDPSGLTIAKVIYDDIVALKDRGLHGIVEDGSQRSFFPTGFAFYVYGETLYDSSRTFEELAEDYFSHAFGENWKKVYEYLGKVGDVLDFAYISGEKSVDLTKGDMYNPAMAELAKKIPEINAEFAPVITENLVQPYRAASVSWQLLEFAQIFFEKVANMIEKKAVGEEVEANRAFKEFVDATSPYEIFFERNYDQRMAYYALSRRFENKAVDTFLGD